ncbi:MAG: adenylyl-sulfate kinase [Leptospirales bacterium]
MTQENIIPYEERSVTKQQREKVNGHQSVILWFTGLSGAGKSTLSHTVEAVLVERGVQAYVLDGDNMRTGISNDLGFSPEDRVENIRRIGEVSKLFLEAGVITLSAFISPYRKDRQIVRSLVAPGDFIEVFVNCPLDVCETRDPKGLYKKARKGEIAEFTGVSAPYEEPENPEIMVNTSESSIEDSVRKIIQYLEDNKLI